MFWLFLNRNHGQEAGRDFFWGTIYLMAQKEIAILLPLSKKMFLFVPTGK